MIESHFKMLTGKLRALAVVAGLLSAVAPVPPALAFDSLESLWPDPLGAEPGEKRKPLVSDEVRLLTLAAHETPPRELNDAERALLAAAEAGDVEAIRKALATGVNVSVRELSGDNALARAVRGNRLEAARELLARGAWPSGKAADGFTPLSTAARSGNRLMVRALLRAGARPDETSDNRNTALGNAALFGRTAVVLELLRHGADPNAFNRDGWTALAIAAVANHPDTMKAMLDEGVAIDALDRRQRPALYYAALHKTHATSEMLLCRGADFRVMTSDISAVVRAALRQLDAEEPLAPCALTRITGTEKKGAQS